MVANSGGSGGNYIRRVAEKAVHDALDQLDLKKAQDWTICCQNDDGKTVTIPDGTIYKVVKAGKPNKCDKCFKIKEDTYYMPGADLRIMQTDGAGGGNLIIKKQKEFDSNYYYYLRKLSGTKLGLFSAYDILQLEEEQFVSKIKKVGFFPGGKYIGIIGQDFDVEGRTQIYWAIIKNFRVNSAGIMEYTLHARGIHELGSLDQSSSEGSPFNQVSTALLPPEPEILPTLTHTTSYIRTSPPITTPQPFGFSTTEETSTTTYTFEDETNAAWNLADSENSELFISFGTVIPVFSINSSNLPVIDILGSFGSNRTRTRFFRAAQKHLIRDVAWEYQSGPSGGPFNLCSCTRSYDITTTYLDGDPVFETTSSPCQGLDDEGVPTDQLRTFPYTDIVDNTNTGGSCTDPANFVTGCTNHNPNLHSNTNCVINFESALMNGGFRTCSPSFILSIETYFQQQNLLQLSTSTAKDGLFVIQSINSGAAFSEITIKDEISSLIPEIDNQSFSSSGAVGPNGESGDNTCTAEVPSIVEEITVVVEGLSATFNEGFKSKLSVSAAAVNTTELPLEDYYYKPYLTLDQTLPSSPTMITDTHIFTGAATESWVVDGMNRIKALDSEKFLGFKSSTNVETGITRSIIKNYRYSTQAPPGTRGGRSISGPSIAASTLNQVVLTDLQLEDYIF